MVYAIAWNEAAPLGSVNANTLETEIQNDKKAVRERMNDLCENTWETDANNPKTLAVSAIAGTPQVALAFSSSTLTLVSATPLILLWDSETLDTGSFHSTSTNTGRMTITTAAYYRLVGAIRVTAGANVADVTLRLKKNGTAIRVLSTPVIALDATTLYMSEVVLAAATDYYELEGEQGSGVDMSVIGGETISAFSIERINGTT